jgi:hypothetical protein
MKIKITEKSSFALIEILGDNGAPASPQNPINAEEYGDIEFPDATGKLAIISGMPTSAIALVSLHYKNVFSAIAIANPRLGVAEVVHSISRSHPVGSSVPLA